MWNNRRMIWDLAKNDFKTKYAGSYLGIVWAFVQPIIITLVYWFVFSIFRSGDVEGCPYVLYLVTGLIVWFYFSEAFSNATNCLLEYSYLVKKVVFQIEVLPIVKVISALFVHLCFIAFVTILYVIFGYYPSFYYIQLIYYEVAVVALVLSLGYLTSAITVFFQDLKQIISIILQVGVWMTPIMWSQDMLSPMLVRVLKLVNPVFYIVQGYRDSFIYHVGFWEKPLYTLYYWCVVVIIMLIGKLVFRRLKPHFADLL